VPSGNPFEVLGDKRIGSQRLAFLWQEISEQAENLPARFVQVVHEDLREAGCGYCCEVSFRFALVFEDGEWIKREDATERTEEQATSGKMFTWQCR
jgi:hypothetical protein